MSTACLPFAGSTVCRAALTCVRLWQPVTTGIQYVKYGLGSCNQHQAVVVYMLLWSQWVDQVLAQARACMVADDMYPPHPLLSHQVIPSACTSYMRTMRSEGCLVPVCFSGRVQPGRLLICGVHLCWGAAHWVTGYRLLQLVC